MPEMTAGTIFIVLGTILVGSFLMSGLRIAIYKYFDFIVEKKVRWEALIYYALLMVLVIVLFLWLFNRNTLLFYLGLLGIILFILLVEYFVFYRRYFEYESAGKYWACSIVAYFANGLLLSLIIELLAVIGLMATQ